MALALALIIYNSTKLDFENLLEGDSLVALIGIFAAACALVLMGILNTAVSISKKQKRR
tara:strand:+ start:289 stop:465 length:177 start_codon:yes stop_codon:yes gene_type:complete